uniref:Uncharacterized protein n=1 Tax=Anguilla anguilla TaxID=7936 RepID=A0A0E9Q8Q1_ANGAN
MTVPPCAKRGPNKAMVRRVRRGGTWAGPHKGT